MSGQLHIVVGPMFASKSSWLISMMRRETYGGSDVVIIKYDKDTRYVGVDPLISTHDKVTHEAVASPATINEVYDRVKGYDVIGIDEGQFFPDLVDFVTRLVKEDNKRVYVSSLDGTWEAKKFGFVLDLIPICDTVQKLSAVCMNENCRSDAIFTHRKVYSVAEIDVGGASKYMSLCRPCYYSARSESVKTK